MEPRLQLVLEVDGASPLKTSISFHCPVPLRKRSLALQSLTTRELNKLCLTVVQQLGLNNFITCPPRPRIASSCRNCYTSFSIDYVESIRSCISAQSSSVDGKCHGIPVEVLTSGQSNLTQGRIAAAHGRFSRILQVAPMCIPYIESQKWLPRQHPLEPRNRLCFHRIA